MTDREKEIFQCQELDFLSFYLLPMLKIPRFLMGGDLKTYLTFSGRIVIAATAVNESFKYRLHEEFLLSFRENGIIYLVFNHPKRYERTIISLMNGEYSKIASDYLIEVRKNSFLQYEVIKSLSNGKKLTVTHPLLEAILGREKIRKTLEEEGIDYNGELLPPLSLYENILDLDTTL